MEKRKSNLLVLVLAALVIAGGWGIASWLSGRSGGTVMAASRAGLNGVVKDDSGKALRGAVITATSGYRSVTRFADQAGQYKITDLKPGAYEVSATAYGFERKVNNKELTGNVEMSFALAPKWDPNALSTAEWLTYLPANEDTLKLEATCIGCHNFSWILKHRGMTAKQWSTFIKVMGTKFVTPQLSDEQAGEIGGILEKYFGPNASLPTREQVRHTEVSDAALRSTFREYKAPTKSYIHSIVAGANGQVWFTEYDWVSNKIGRFDVATEEFQEIPVPTAKAAPHNPWIAQDGRVWFTENSTDQLGVIDPRTGKVTEYKAPTPGGPHTLRDDSAGNIWYADTTGGKVVQFDPRTEKFQEYKVPLPATIPDQYFLNRSGRFRPGDENFHVAIYDLAVDSHDNIWFCTAALGHVGRLDSKTGEFKFYPIPGASNMKGVEVDKNDHVWFASFLGHKLGKINPATGEIKQYQLPTAHANPYGIVVDKNGNIWTSDFGGSHLTKFNPATEAFTEYPFPTSIGMARFMGLDPQGRIWYTEFATGKIGVMDTGEMPAAARGTRKVAAVSNR